MFKFVLRRWNLLYIEHVYVSVMSRLIGWLETEKIIFFGGGGIKVPCSLRMGRKNAKILKFML